MMLGEGSRTSMITNLFICAIIEATDKIYSDLTGKFCRWPIWPLPVWMLLGRCFFTSCEVSPGKEERKPASIALRSVEGTGEPNEDHGPTINRPTL